MKRCQENGENSVENEEMKQKINKKKMSVCFAEGMMRDQTGGDNDRGVRGGGTRYGAR